MNFSVRESDVLQVVMGYLRGKGCYEALSALALESNSSIGVLGNDMLYLQKIVLQGRWDTVTRFLDDIKEDLGPDVSIRMSFLIQKQRYLELLSWQGGGEQRMAFPPWRPLSCADKKVEAEADQNIEMGCILQQLNVLKSLCSTSEFNALCAFLTVDKLETQAGYEHWTVAQGRWDCFSDIRAVLATLLPGENTIEPELNSSLKEGLLNTVAMSLAYQTALATDIPLEDSHGEHKAQLHLPAGFIVPSRDTRRIQSILNSEGAPSLAIVSPVKALRRFDQVVPAPQLGYKVHHITGTSPGRHGKINENERIKYSPPRSIPSMNGGVEHHVSVAAPAYLGPPLTVHPPPLQQQPPANQTYTAGIPRPISSVPSVPPVAYGHALPGQVQEPMAIASSPQYQQQVPAPAPLSGQQPQRLSIETGGFHGDLRGLHDSQPSSAHQPVQTSNPSSYAHAPGQQSVTQPLTEAFTPHNQFPPGYAHPPQYSPYGDVAPSGYTQQPYISAQQQYTPGGYNYDGYGQPQQLTSAGRPTSGSVQLHNPQVVAPNQTYVELPSSQGGRGRAPVAWTVGQDTAETEQTKPPSSIPKEPGVLAAAFTVGEVDESKVKPMPAALRKKMLADQQAAAAAEEERIRMEQEIAGSERASSRGRSRSAPRGNAGAVAVAAPPSTGRPVSVVRSRGVGSHIPTPTPGLHSQNSPDRGGFAGAVRRSSDQDKAAASDKARQQPSTNGSRNLAMAAPGSDLSVNSGSHVSRTNSSRAAGGAAAEYTPSVLFKTDFPLRCFNALGVSPPDSVRLAVGSNAKAIYTMTYARNQLAASNNLGVISGTGPGVTLQAELSNIHTGSVYCMDWHEGAGLLVSGSNDKAIRLSNPSNGQVSGVLKEHNGTIRTVKFLGGSSGSEHASSLLFASAGGGDCATRVWDAQSAKVVRALSKHAESVHGLTWLGPDMLLTGCDQGQIIGHDLRSARPAWAYNLNDLLAQSHGETLRRGVCCLAVLDSPSGSFHPQNLLVAAGCGGGFVSVFNATSGQIHSHQQLHASDVRSLCVMPTLTRRKEDGIFDILTGSYDGTLGLWRASSRGQDFRYTSSRILKGHNDKVLCAAPVAMPGQADSDILSTGADGKAILWSVH